MAKNSKKLIGAWAFLVGVILAVVMGLVGQTAVMATFAPWAVGILVIAGILIGLLNVTGKESQKFLLAGLAMVIVASLGISIVGGSLDTIGSVSNILVSILLYLLILFVPTTIIVALKSVFDIARD